MTNHLGYASTVHRVLEIPEIVEHVFSFLDRRDLATNASICRRWSEIALDLLWRNVDDLHRLFSLLAPLTTSEHTPPIEYHSFSRTLNPDDWKRFSRYARRVRKLSYNEDSHRTSLHLGPLVFDEVARSRTTLNILPNLCTLEWSSERLRLSLVFMSENVKQFTVRLHNSEAYPLSDFFDDIAVRMPLLTHLDLSFDFPVRDIEKNLIPLTQSLTKLQEIVMPLYCLSSKVVEGLSSLPNLGTIQFEFMGGQGRGDVADVHHFDPSLEEGAFPALWDLSLSAHLPDMTRFLTKPHAPANLTSLYVHVLSVVPPSSVTEFLTTVSKNCKLLTNLYLDFFSGPDAFVQAVSQTSDRLTWEDLRPILSCTKLTVFEFHWDSPLTISQDNIEELASNWPALQVLMLNCDPTFPLLTPEPSSLTLRALLPFAQHCPDLEELGLYVSGTAADLDLASLSPHDPAAVPSALQPFRKLSKLCVGLSSIAEPGPVALFLSQICPLGCEVTPGVSWPDGFGMPETEDNRDALDEVQRRVAEWYDGWKDVGRVLPLLTRLRMEERERRRVLEREVEDLRVRCKVLEERATMPNAMNINGSCLVL